MVMKERLALDTNIAIDILNGNTLVIQLLEEVSSFFLPVTVCGELLYGYGFQGFASAAILKHGIPAPADSGFCSKIPWRSPDRRRSYTAEPFFPDMDTPSGNPNTALWPEG